MKNPLVRWLARLAPLLLAVQLLGAAPAAAEPTFAVMLLETGSKKIHLIKVVRAWTRLGLKDTKDLVESAPVFLLDGLDEERSTRLLQELDAVGATAVAEYRVEDPEWPAPEGAEPAAGWLDPPAPPRVLAPPRYQTAVVKTWNLFLRSVGDRRAEVLGVVRRYTGLDAERAAARLDAAPVALLGNVSVTTAQRAQQELRALGADVLLTTFSRTPDDRR